MRLTEKCKYCGKILEVSSEQESGALGLYLYSYKCGHSEIRKKIILKDEQFSNLDGSKVAYQFQVDGVKFAESTNFNCMIADSMGLGKTIQSLLAVRNAVLFPCVVIVKTSTIYQWTREIQDWASAENFSTYPIIGTQTPIIPGFKFYVVSMDTFSRNGMWKSLAKLNPKCIIVDECHSFKNDSSKRTSALVEFCKVSNSNRLFLSGTPIKNRANEFFIPLNLLSPTNFPSRRAFERRWLVPNEKGIYSRLKSWALEDFHKLVGKFVIRREKEDIFKDLPPLTRDYQFVETEDENMKNLYNNELDLFSNWLEGGEKIDAMNLLGWLAKLRRITAVAKIPLVKEWIDEFREDSDEKLAIGMHHTAVRDNLKLVYPNALSLSGEDSAADKDRIIEEFKKPERDLLVINIGSGGLGLNIQFCHNAVILERYWNAADEEQFEGRFHRHGQTSPVQITYMMLAGSIDQWFHDLVLEKKKIFGETVCSWNFSSDTTALKELAWKTVRNRL